MASAIPAPTTGACRAGQIDPERAGTHLVQLRRLDQIEARVNALRVPASFAGEAYTLRAHMRMVRERLAAR